ncbi:carbohydrate-binding module family 18 protein [Dothidotthia symphoricarpi CBS 119687]|uniref:chitinase n=1 Tax=Dothidotthia symphoricarpi CBS 119687 TaxID=1392245 RepID=A0A6A6AVK9_9PLEO|nr:carbohydrate-binding module family 18 protein [Dothidotthia symphoricarpi CBS 119687]KAF2134995.1 carbohydrate-binding module family 18 protein [Dothidotthia symphoricarpi CBS 119687]
MRFSSAVLLAPLFLAVLASARFVIYLDEWHPTRPTDPKDRAGIDHIILAFAMANSTATFQPKVPISTIRSEFPNAKVMIAVGGWGDDLGFNELSKTDAGIQSFAADVATMLANTGADGVDIDWEYPGGNGADYKQVANSAKVYQIDAFPKLLEATRAAIGPEKLLSIAAPGRQEDMIAYTPTTSPKIWPHVDFINVMTYDLTNRRSPTTQHHTSLTSSTSTIKSYLTLGFPPTKLNLGFAFYAKYFTVANPPSCTTALNCPLAPAEDPQTGADLLTSGAWTFEKAHMSRPVATHLLPESTDGTCGPDAGTRCGAGCCSQYGSCGTSVQHCKGACWHAYGSGCVDVDVSASWGDAVVRGVTDEGAGAQYYFDRERGLFWTWDTVELVGRKFEEVVGRFGLGGVMAWSLGEDSADWGRVGRMAWELERCRGVGAGVVDGDGGNYGSTSLPQTSSTMRRVRRQLPAV